MIDRALIVGAGIGGLAAAAALAHRGVEIDVVEVKPDNSVFGVGINQPANSLRALAKIGVLDEVLEAGFVWDRVRFCDFAGNLFAEIPSGLGGDDVPPNCALPRRALHEILLDAAQRAGADVTFAQTVTTIRQDGGSVDVTFTDGSTAAYPLIVGFDGIRSTVRDQVFGSEYAPVSTGYGAWRVTVPRPPEVTCPAVFQNCGNKAGYIPLTQETMYLLGVTPAPPGVHYEPYELVKTLVEWLGDYGGIIAEIRDSLTEAHDVVYVVMEEVFLPPPWHEGRVLVAGDAAHACAPHLTQGAAMALEDAVVLAEVLADLEDVPAALAAFTERRSPRAQFVQDASHAVLAGEGTVTDSAALAMHAKFCAEVLPHQQAEMDAFINQPA